MRRAELDDVEQRLQTLLREVRVAEDSKRAVVTYSAEGAPAEARVLSADNCEDLISSVALISAMAIEGSRNAGQPPPVAPATAGEPDPPTTISEEAPAPTAATTNGPAANSGTLIGEEPSGEAPRAEARATAPAELAGAAPGTLISPLSTTDGSAERSSAASSNDSHGWGVALGATIDAWTGPSSSPGADLALSFTPNTGRWTLRVGARYARSATSVEEREAIFHMLGASLEGCFALLEEPPMGFGLELGARTVAGTLVGRGVDSPALPRTEQHVIPWLDGAMFVRAVSPAWRQFRLELQAEAGTPLIEHRFEFEEPQTTVFHPRVAPKGGARLGVRGEW